MAALLTEDRIPFRQCYRSAPLVLYDGNEFGWKAKDAPMKNKTRKKTIPFLILNLPLELIIKSIPPLHLLRIII